MYVYCSFFFFIYHLNFLWTSILDSSENLEVEEMVEDDGDDKNGILEEVWSDEEILTEPDSEPVPPGLELSQTNLFITAQVSPTNTFTLLIKESSFSINTF